MERKNQYGGYFLAAGLGAIGGGILVTAVTRAIPKMMSKMMPTMMASMIAQMGAGECDPAEM